MAANNTISVSFVMKDGANGLKTLTANADDLRKVLSATTTTADKLAKKFKDFAAFSTSLNNISGALSGLQGILGELTTAYAVQETAETKLMTVMRQRMGATDEEIQSIKDLASAQQEIGVIGDEVQLSGAQQIVSGLSRGCNVASLRG